MGCLSADRQTNVGPGKELGIFSPSLTSTLSRNLTDVWNSCDGTEGKRTGDECLYIIHGSRKDFESPGDQFNGYFLAWELASRIICHWLAKIKVDAQPTRVR